MRHWFNNWHRKDALLGGKGDITWSNTANQFPNLKFVWIPVINFFCESPVAVSLWPMQLSPTFQH